MNRILVVALALSLAACAGEPRWSKEGTSPEAAARDYAECQSAAQDAMRRDLDIDQDIMASRGGDWQRSGVLAAKQATNAARNRPQEGAFVSSCMVGKGYVPGG